MPASLSPFVNGYFTRQFQTYLSMWPPFNRAYFVEVLIEGLFFFLNINVSLGYREAS